VWRRGEETLVGGRGRRKGTYNAIEGTPVDDDVASLLRLWIMHRPIMLAKRILANNKKKSPHSPTSKSVGDAQKMNCDNTDNTFQSMEDVKLDDVSAGRHTQFVCIIGQTGSFLLRDGRNPHCEKRENGKGIRIRTGGSFVGQYVETFTPLNRGREEEVSTYRCKDAPRACRARRKEDRDTLSVPKDPMSSVRHASTIHPQDLKDQESVDQFLSLRKT
jgi:hypothetical protein